MRHPFVWDVTQRHIPHERIRIFTAVYCRGDAEIFLCAAVIFNLKYT